MTRSDDGVSASVIGSGSDGQANANDTQNIPSSGNQIHPDYKFSVNEKGGPKTTENKYDNGSENSLQADTLQRNEIQETTESELEGTDIPDLTRLPKVSRMG